MPKSRMTLHQAMVTVLIRHGLPMHPSDIATEINKLGLYVRGDKKPVPTSQIHARFHRYTHLFEKRDSLIALCPAPSLRPMTEADADAIAAIFGYFILHSFAAYHSTPITGGAIAEMIRAHPKEYPCYAVEIEGKVVGFGELRPIHHGDTLKRTAEVGYFLKEECAGRGIGSMLLERLESDARAMGVDNLIASISSRNELSLEFHRKHGFVECGRFRRSGRKFDQDFDVVWMQKFL